MDTAEAARSTSAMAAEERVFGGEETGIHSFSGTGG